jgi:adenylate cyclase
VRLITLDKEIRKSEILRVTAAAWLAFFFAMYLPFLMIYFPNDYDLIFMHHFQRIGVVCALLGFSGYYVILRYVLIQCERRAISIPKWTWYLVTLLETSTPTLILYLLAQIHPPAEVILSSRLLLYFIFIALTALYVDEAICIFAGLVAALEYSGLAFHLLNISDIPHLEPYIFGTEQIINRAKIFFIVGCVIAFVTHQIKHQLFAAFQANKEREQITTIFGHHVSPEVVNTLLSHINTKLTETKFVCVLFLDIRNFTAYAENKKPEEVVDYLNQLFGFMIDIVSTHDGIINKFLGDGFMAVFGAPITGKYDTDHAVRAAEDILAQLEKEIELGNIPKTRIGIGLHCGRVVTGNVGAVQRQEYTIIGDVVNSASRIEKLNKKYSSQLLISEDVYEQLAVKRGELLGQVELSGRGKSMNIYRLK